VAKKVRETFTKLPQIESAHVDATSRVVFRTKNGVVPDKEAISVALKPQKIATMRESRRPKVAQVVKITAKGFA
jgi:hypothetical protein